MPAPCVAKARTALAAESGRIMSLTEKQIRTAATDYPLRRIKQTVYQWGMGENPLGIRFQVAPPLRTEYQPFLPTGTYSGVVIDPDGDGTQTISTTLDNTGRGCSLAAETLHFGFQEFGRCLVGTALETDPMCITDLLQKYSWSSYIKALRDKLPGYLKDTFARELLRQVARLAYRKYSVVQGFGMNVNQPNFPAVPTGGLDIGYLRRIENRMNPHGWADGADIKPVNGRIPLEVYCGRDAIEFAIINRKLQRGLSLKSRLTEDDGTFGQTEVYEGIRFIENPLPTRGYLVETATNTFEFREINPYIVIAGTEGIVMDDNPMYNSSNAYIGGATYRVCELAHIIHPRAMERQAAVIPPGMVDGMDLSKEKFNFEVEFINDFRVADRECNKDLLMFQYRATHAYAPYSENPELMTAIIFLAATPQTLVTDPDAVEPPTNLQAVNVQQLPLPRADSCTPCADGTIEREDTLPTCSDLFPAETTGVVQFNIIAYAVNDTQSGVTIFVQRSGGSTGTASVAYATANGTALAGTNYTNTSGTLNWAAGQGNVQSFVVPITNHTGSDNGLAFTVGLSSVTGATLGAQTTATVTIVDPTVIS